jgi:serine O-acetyltransferase
MFPNIREDWATYERDIWRQGLWAMLVYRYGCWRYRVRWTALRWPLSLLYRFLKVGSQILTGIDLPCETRVGRRLLIEHFGGIIISGDTVIGNDVVIRQGVTLGLRRRGQPGAPIIGDRVDIGAGAKILGPVRIGDDAVIGANAVVLDDVPAGATAVGIPARIKPPRAVRSGGAAPAGPGAGDAAAIPDRVAA